jgi:serine/threonine-protein kinase
VSSATHSSEPGALLGRSVGSFVLERELGAGGMGTVYLGRHAQIGSRVAIKVLRADLGANPDMLERFWNEARAANRIGHPNIVKVIDCGSIEHPGGEDALHFLVMELLEGESLRALLEREGALSTDRAVDITRQVAGALAAAHREGIVHRDLKPDNIFLVESSDGDDPAVKLLDFGIAKLFDVEAVPRTESGVRLGTVAYMAPEQLHGEPVDRRADVYSLGLVLVEMVAGELPKLDDRLGGLAEIDGLEAAPELAAAVQRAIALRPRDRFATMAELEEALIGDPAGTRHSDEKRTRPMLPAALRAARQKITSPGPPRRAERSRWPLAAGAAAVALGLGLWLASIRGGGPAPDPAADPAIGAPAVGGRATVAGAATETAAAAPQGDESPSTVAPESEGPDAATTRLRGARPEAARPATARLRRRRAAEISLDAGSVPEDAAASEARSRDRIIRPSWAEPDAN